MTLLGVYKLDKPKTRMKREREKRGREGREGRRRLEGSKAL